MKLISRGEAVLCTQFTGKARWYPLATYIESTGNTHSIPTLSCIEIAPKIISRIGDSAVKERTNHCRINAVGYHFEDRSTVAHGTRIRTSNHRTVALHCEPFSIQHESQSTPVWHIRLGLCARGTCAPCKWRPSRAGEWQVLLFLWMVRWNVKLCWAEMACYSTMVKNMERSKVVQREKVKVGKRWKDSVVVSDVRGNWLQVAWICISVQYSAT